MSRFQDNLLPFEPGLEDPSVPRLFLYYGPSRYICALSPFTRCSIGKCLPMKVTGISTEPESSCLSGVSVPYNG